MNAAGTSVYNVAKGSLGSLSEGMKGSFGSLSDMMRSTSSPKSTGGKSGLTEEVVRDVVREAFHGEESRNRMWGGFGGEESGKSAAANAKDLV